MAKATDILLDNDGDLPIEANDFTIGLSDQEHIQNCLIAYNGYWKQFFTAGVGIEQYQFSSGLNQVLARKIREQLTADNYDVGTPLIAYVGGKLTVNPNAERK